MRPRGCGRGCHAVLESKGHPHRCRIHRMFPRLKRLNGWQRIGVVLSIAWALYGFYWGNEYGLRQGDWTQSVYESCMDGAQRFAADAHYSKPSQQEYEKKIAACEQQRDRNWRASISGHWVLAAICAFVPIPLGWGVVYGLIALVKWIRRGFKIPPNSDLPTPGRTAPP